MTVIREDLIDHLEEILDHTKNALIAKGYNEDSANAFIVGIVDLIQSQKAKDARIAEDGEAYRACVECRNNIRNDILNQ